MKILKEIKIKTIQLHLYNIEFLINKFIIIFVFVSRLYLFLYGLQKCFILAKAEKRNHKYILVLHFMKIKLNYGSVDHQIY